MFLKRKNPISNDKMLTPVKTDAGRSAEQVLAKDLDRGFLRSLEGLNGVSDSALDAVKGRLEAAQTNPNYKIFAAVKDGEATGLAAVLVEDKSIHGIARMGHLEYVFAEDRNCKSDLIVAASNLAEQMGSYKIIADCSMKEVTDYEVLEFAIREREMYTDLLNFDPQKSSTSNQYPVREINANDLTNGGFFEAIQNLARDDETPSDTAALAWLNTIQSNPYHKTFVAVAGAGEVVGSTTILGSYRPIGQDGQIKDIELMGHIEDVVTKKGYEGQGIGSSLVNVALKEGKEMGFREAILECSDKNIPFYEKNRFIRRNVEVRRDLHPEKPIKRS